MDGAWNPIEIVGGRIRDLTAVDIQGKPAGGGPEPDRNSGHEVGSERHQSHLRRHCHGVIEIPAVAPGIEYVVCALQELYGFGANGVDGAQSPLQAHRGHVGSAVEEDLELGRISHNVDVPEYVRGGLPKGGQHERREHGEGNVVLGRYAQLPDGAPAGKDVSAGGKRPRMNRRAGRKIQYRAPVVESAVQFDLDASRAGLRVGRAIRQTQCKGVRLDEHQLDPLQSRIGGDGLSVDV